MAGKGFAYNPGVYWDELLVEIERAANPLNEAAARALGYHSPPRPEPPAGIGGGEGHEYDIALSGSDDGTVPGCASTAMKVAYEVVEPIGADVQALLASSPASESFFASPGGAALLDAWSRCMGEQGYVYTSPLQALAQFTVNDVVSSEEVAVRMADLGCDRQVGLTEARSTWERSFFDEWMIETAIQWAAIEDDIQRAIEHLTALRNDDE